MLGHLLKVDCGCGFLVVLDIFDANACETFLERVTTASFIRIGGNFLDLEDSQVVSTLRFEQTFILVLAKINDLVERKELLSLPDVRGLSGPM